MTPWPCIVCGRPCPDIEVFCSVQCEADADRRADEEAAEALGLGDEGTWEREQQRWLS